MDYDRLAVLDGLHTTETLIEAIFNPVPTSSEAPSPFTFYDPAQAQKREELLLQQDTDANSGEMSIDSSSSSLGNPSSSSQLSGGRKNYPASERSHSSAGSMMETQKPHWWQKLQKSSVRDGGASRPGTPSGRNVVRPLTPRFSGEHGK